MSQGEKTSTKDMGVSLVSWQSMVTVAGASPQTVKFIPLWPCRKEGMQVGPSTHGRGLGCGNGDRKQVSMQPSYQSQQEPLMPQVGGQQAQGGVRNEL